MNANRALLLATSALSLYGVGQVWLVQLSSYRLWTRVGASEFSAYHAVWWRSIWGVVLGPAALVVVGAFVMPWLPPPGAPIWAPWVGCGLQTALMVGTAFWWGPLMARIEAPEGGVRRDRYKLLMSTHWLRVAIVTAFGALTLWMVAQGG